MKNLKDVKYRIKVEQAEYQVAIRFGAQPIPLDVYKVDLTEDACFFKAFTKVAKFVDGMAETVGAPVYKFKKWLGDCAGQYRSNCSTVSQCIWVFPSYVVEARLVIDHTKGGHKDMKARDAAISDFVTLSYLDENGDLENLYHNLVDIYGESAREAIIKRIFFAVDDEEALEELTEAIGRETVEGAIQDLDAYLVSRGFSDGSSNH